MKKKPHNPFKEIKYQSYQSMLPGVTKLLQDSEDIMRDSNSPPLTFAKVADPSRLPTAIFNSNHICISLEASWAFQDSHMGLNTYRRILNEVTAIYLNHFLVGERALNLDSYSSAAK